MTSATVGRLADLFRETGAFHHRAFAATAGDDPEWPTWYAESLAPRLPALVGRSFSVPEIADLLRQWDREYSAGHVHDPWPEFYARSLLSLRDPGN